MNDVTAELKKRSDSFQLQCVEGVNNVLDYIEFSLENYTLPPSDGKRSNNRSMTSAGEAETKLCSRSCDRNKRTISFSVVEQIFASICAGFKEW